MVNKATAGTDYTTSAYWSRWMQSIPASYTIWKDGTTYRGECNVSGGSDQADASCTTVLQNAINALTTGGLIFFRPGDYYINKISVPSFITLMGSGTAYSGANNTRIRINDNVNDHMFVNSQQVAGNTDINFYNLSFYGNRTNETAGDIINLVTASRCRIKDCYFDSAYRHAVYVGDACGINHVDNCHMLNAGTNGIRCDYSDNWFTNNEIDVVGDGIYINGANNQIIGNQIGICAIGLYGSSSADHCTVIGNRVDTNSSHGISWTGTYSTISNNRAIDNAGNGLNIIAGHNTIVGNVAYSNDLSGIVLAQISDVSVVGNNCYLNTRHGIYAYDSTELSINGNTCYGNDVASAGYDGIFIDKVALGTVTNISLVGNVCCDTAGAATQRYGINIDADTDYLAILGNVCRNNRTGNLQNSSTGANNQVANNVT